MDQHPDTWTSEGVKGGLELVDPPGDPPHQGGPRIPKSSVAEHMSHLGVAKRGEFRLELPQRGHPPPRPLPGEANPPPPHFLSRAEARPATPPLGARPANLRAYSASKLVNG